MTVPSNYFESPNTLSYYQFFTHIMQYAAPRVSSLRKGQRAILSAPGAMRLQRPSLNPRTRSLADLIINGPGLRMIRFGKPDCLSLKLVTFRRFKYGYCS